MSERSRLSSTSNATNSTINTGTAVASYGAAQSEDFRPAVLTLSVFEREADPASSASEQGRTRWA